VLALIWLLREPPVSYSPCSTQAPAAWAGEHAAWVAGDRPIFVSATLLILVTILRISAWRTGRRPTLGTVVMAGVVAAYAVACGIQTELFGIYALPVVLAWLFWPVALPVAVLAAAIASVRIVLAPPEDKGLAALSVLAWASLVVAVGGIAAAVGFLGEPQFCLD